MLTRVTVKNQSEFLPCKEISKDPKMMYSPYFKDKLLLIKNPKKIINDNPKDTINKNKLTKDINDNLIYLTLLPESHSK